LGGVPPIGIALPPVLAGTATAEAAVPPKPTPAPPIVPPAERPVTRAEMLDMFRQFAAMQQQQQAQQAQQQAQAQQPPVAPTPPKDTGPKKKTWGYLAQPEQASTPQTGTPHEKQREEKQQPRGGELIHLAKWEIPSDVCK